MSGTETIEMIDVDALERYANDSGWVVVVHNDDVNTFDHVIVSFIEVLGMTAPEAAKAALLVHTEGAAALYQGAKPDCAARVQALTQRLITATLEVA